MTNFIEKHKNLEKKKTEGYIEINATNVTT